MKIGKIALNLLAVYLVFALVTSTAPHVRSKQVSPQALESFSQISYRGESPVGPDRVALVENTTQAFSARVGLLREAEHTLDIVYHTIQEGESTDAFFGEVVKAADRGVKVRLILDGKTGMAPSSRRLMKALGGHENIQCRLYNPLNLLRPWEWHTLLHDKFILMDQELLLLGGRNIGDRFFNPEGYTGKVTDDREVLVWRAGEGEESVMPQVEEYMEALWAAPCTGPAPAQGEGKAAPRRERLAEAAARFEERNPVYYTQSLGQYKAAMVPAAKITLVANPIHTGQKEPWVGHHLRELVRDAKAQVLIQTPYATANRYILETLADAAQAADATLLINSMAGSPNFPAFSNYYFNRKKFLATGAEIYEYQSQHSIHGKSMVFDGRISAVGSFNLDDRSLYIDTETMLIIDSPAFAQELSGAIRHYMDSSLKVGEDNRYEEGQPVAPAPVSTAKKAGMYLVSLLSRLIQFLI